MNNNDKTVCDPGATKRESDATVYEGAATVADSTATVPDSAATVTDSAETQFDGGDISITAAALSDAAKQAYAPASNPSIKKGDTLLDTYRVESDAISGGMGSVWRVRHTGWNADLAMKRPQPKCFATEKSKADFIHECEAWINLGLHPNIVSCYYVREISGTPSIFSEWMDGGSLGSAIKSGALYKGSKATQQERILDIAIQFARGLHYAHEAGLIHQDVKPDNLLLTKDGDAKVADFGLARARAVLTVAESGLNAQENVDSSKTIASPSGGYTPAYCSMEQMDGKELTRRTDIYSWAVSIMEMYVGARPWANGVVAGLSCRGYFEDTKLPMPEALKELLTKCMEAEPDDRPHDFAQIEDRLQEIYRAETGNAYPREAPKAAADTADSLNNRALSMLDLGKPDEADRLWAEALGKDSNHVGSNFNMELHLWRSGRKYDFEAMDSLNRIASVREAKSADAILRESGGLRTPLLESARGTHSTGSEATSALLCNNELYFTYVVDGKPGIKRMKLDSSEIQDMDYMEAVCKLGVPVRHIALQPGARLAAVLLQNCTALLYDMRSRRIVENAPPLENVPSEFLRFSPDGTLLLLGNRAEPRTIAVETATLSIVLDEAIRFLGFFPDGSCLCRAHQLRKPEREALYRLRLGGDLEAVYLFRDDIAAAKEVDTGDDLFLAYHTKSGAYFGLNAEFEEIPLDERFFNSASGIICYDRGRDLLYTRFCYSRQDNHIHLRIAVWDARHGACLFTVAKGDFNAMDFVPTEDRRAVIAWLGAHQTTAWLHAELPAPNSGYTATWQLSRIATVSKRHEEESRIDALAQAFRGSYEEGGYARALTLWQECRSIRGFSGSETADEMEDALARVAKKSALHAVRCIGTASVLPDMAYNNLYFRKMLRTQDKLLLAMQSDAGRWSVKIFPLAGGRAKTIRFPRHITRVELRAENAIAFNAALNCEIYDSNGTLLTEPLDTWRPKNRLYCPDFYDVDSAGEHMLLGKTGDTDPFGTRQEKGLFERNLRTGEERRINPDCLRAHPHYLADGLILRTDEKSMTSYCSEDMTVRHRYPLTFEHVVVCGNVKLSSQRDRILHFTSLFQGPGEYYHVFALDGTLLCRWFEQENLSDSVLLPGDRFVCIWGTEQFKIHDLTDGREMYAHKLSRIREIFTQPDGRSLYVLLQDESILVFRLDYDYTLQ